jgi:hypothetical protein
MILLMAGAATVPPRQPGFASEGVGWGCGNSLSDGKSPAQPAQRAGAVESFNGASRPSMGFLLTLYHSFVTVTTNPCVNFRGWQLIFRGICSVCLEGFSCIPVKHF